MKSTEIITINPITANELLFIDNRLTKATQRIASIYKDASKYADTKNREIAKILADVADNKAYEIDGFKSVADYASTVFGIARQNAYALANAGKVYNDKNAHPELQAMSPSKIAELATVDTNVLNEALKEGTITHDTTQKTLRDFAKMYTESEKPKVMPTYTVLPYLVDVDDSLKDVFSTSRLESDWDDWFVNYVSDISPRKDIEIAKLPKSKLDPKSNKVPAIRKLYFNCGYSIVVEFYKYIAPKVTKPVDTKYTKEQLIAMLAEMEVDENGAK